MAALDPLFLLFGLIFNFFWFPEFGVMWFLSMCPWDCPTTVCLRGRRKGLAVSSDGLGSGVRQLSQDPGCIEFAQGVPSTGRV